MVSMEENLLKSMSPLNIIGEKNRRIIVMIEENKERSGTTLKRIGQNFKKSKGAFKIGLLANTVAILAFIISLLRIFSLYAVITFGVCAVIAFIAYLVLFIDISTHRGK